MWLGEIKPFLKSHISPHFAKTLKPAEFFSLVCNRIGAKSSKPSILHLFLVFIFCHRNIRYFQKLFLIGFWISKTPIYDRVSPEEETPIRDSWSGRGAFLVFSLISLSIFVHLESIQKNFLYKLIQNAGKSKPLSSGIGLGQKAPLAPHVSASD